MKPEEIHNLAAAVKGYWPYWRVTPEQTEILWALFGDLPYDAVLQALREHRLTDPEDGKHRRPSFREVQREVLAALRAGQPDHADWNWGDEANLAQWQAFYDERGTERPADEWLIRQRMHREPPPAWKRRQVQDAIRAYCRERGIPTTVAEARQLQQRNRDIHDECRRKSAAAVRERERNGRLEPPAGGVAPPQPLVHTERSGISADEFFKTAKGNDRGANPIHSNR